MRATSRPSSTSGTSFPTSNDSEAAPYLLLGVANGMLRFEADAALAALSRAVKAFNDLNPSDSL